MSDAQETNYPAKNSAGQRIRSERELRGWSQQYVADQLGADRYYLSRWEHSKMLPSPYYREKLCQLFGKNARELGFLGEGTEQVVDTSLLAVQASTMLHDPFIPPLRDAPYALVGRQDQLSTLKARLCVYTPSMALALHGLPGVGKTALAVALAHDEDIRASFPDGLLWVGVGKQPDVIGTLSRWGALLGIAPAEASRLTTYESWVQAIRAAIGSRRMLLIIDDIWTPEAFVSFKIGGNACAYLVTTRFPQLAWQAAANGAFPVSELSASESLFLLEHLAPLVVQQEPTLVAELVRLVGGLPLALLLAGNFLRGQAYNGQPRRIRQAIERLRTVEMRLHLQEPLAFAERSPSLANAPSVSLHTLIAVSDRQLDQEAHEALVALSVFPAKPNTFSEDAALAVCQGSGSALDALSDAGLLEGYASGRYALHQTIADYASLQRVDSAPVERFIRFTADYVQYAGTDYPLLEQESVNILAALRLASGSEQRDMLIATGNTFAALLLLHGSYMEAIDLLKRVCQAAEALHDHHGWATGLYRLGEIAMNQGEYTQAQEYLQQGLVLTAGLQEISLRSRLLRMLGNVEGYQGDYSSAELHLQEAITLARHLQDNELLSLVLRSQGAIASDQGKFVEAEGYVREGLTLARRTGKADLICPLLINLDQIVLVRGQYAQAEEVITEALVLATQIGFRSAMCLLQQHLGLAALEQRKYAQAQEPFEQSLALARSLQQPEYIVGGLVNLGVLFMRQDGYEQARLYLEEGLALTRTLANPLLLAGVLEAWGELYLRQELLTEAATAFHELHHCMQSNQEYEALALYGQARIASAQGNLLETRELGEASLALLQAMEHYRLPEVKQWLAAALQEER